MYRMTERRKRIVRFLHQFSQEHGWAPSYTEIAKSVQTSIGIIGYDLRVLDVLGFIHYCGNRQIKVLWLP